MRIISNRRDYYDCIMRYNQEHDDVWIRNPKVIKGKYNLITFPMRAYSEIITTHRVVGFCGEVYGLVELDYNNNEALCYSIKDVDKFVEDNFKKRHLKHYYAKKYNWVARRWIKCPWRGDFVEFFESFTKKKRYQKLFLKHSTPVFVIENNQIIINASNLGDLEFFRIFDPYRAYQELTMYIGRIGNNEDKIPKISDADMLIAKGFDPRLSFRQDSPGKKRRRREKKKYE